MGCIFATNSYNKIYNMKHNIFRKSNNILLSTLAGITLLTGMPPARSMHLHSSRIDAQEVTSFNQFKGEVVDGQNNKPLVFATITLEGSNISTITNTEGKFLLKIPTSVKQGNINVSLFRL